MRVLYLTPTIISSLKFESGSKISPFTHVDNKLFHNIQFVETLYFKIFNKVFNYKSLVLQFLIIKTVINLIKSIIFVVYFIISFEFFGQLVGIFLKHLHDFTGSATVTHRHMQWPHEKFWKEVSGVHRINCVTLDICEQFINRFMTWKFLTIDI